MSRKILTGLMLGLIIMFSSPVFARMSIEQIKRDYIFEYFPDLIITQCRQNPQLNATVLCVASENDLWWKFYAYVDAQKLWQVAYDEGLILKNMMDGYQGGCLRVKFEVRKPRYPEATYDLKEVVDTIWIIHYLPTANGCFEGNSGDYGDVESSDMETADE